MEKLIHIEKMDSRCYLYLYLLSISLSSDLQDIFILLSIVDLSMVEVKTTLFQETLMDNDIHEHLVTRISMTGLHHGIL